MEESPNLSYLHDLSGEDYDFEELFIKRFKEEFLWEAGMYLRYIQLGEPIAASVIVTQSKYKLSMLGLERGFDVALAHEEHLQKGNKTMHNEFWQILKKVNTFLNNIE